MDPDYQVPAAWTATRRSRLRGGLCGVSGLIVSGMVCIQVIALEGFTPDVWRAMEPTQRAAFLLPGVSILCGTTLIGWLLRGRSWRWWLLIPLLGFLGPALLAAVVLLRMARFGYPG